MALPSVLQRPPPSRHLIEHIPQTSSWPPSLFSGQPSSWPPFASLGRNFWRSARAVTHTLSRVGGPLHRDPPILSRGDIWCLNRGSEVRDGQRRASYLRLLCPRKIFSILCRIEKIIHAPPCGGSLLLGRIPFLRVSLLRIRPALGPLAFHRGLHAWATP